MLRAVNAFLAESTQAASKAVLSTGAGLPGLPALRRCCLSPKREKQEFPKTDPTQTSSSARRKKKIKQDSKPPLENARRLLDAWGQGQRVHTRVDGSRPKGWHGIS